MKNRRLALLALMGLTASIGAHAADTPRSACLCFATGWGGNAKVGKYRYGTTYPKLIALRSSGTCWLRNKDVATYFDRQGEPWRFRCPANDEPEINGAYGVLNDAHHFAGVVVDMYKSWFGAPPLDQPVKLQVHQSDTYWSHAKNLVALDDGDEAFYPAAVLDVIAHEISHGFTRRNSRLGQSGQSRAMSEAFSDMAGEAAKFFARGGRNDFLHGADSVKRGVNGVRNMCDPTSDGVSIDEAADYHHGMDGHFASGVYNKAFCLLAKTPGWNTRNAFEVFHGANRIYWDADSDFDGGACGVQAAAQDRGYSKEAVATAFADVGVSCEGDIELREGVPVRGLSGAAGSVRNYKVVVPPGVRDLRISAYGGSGNADLYVSYVARPTSSAWDCHPDLVNSNEFCAFENRPPAGTYYIQLRGKEAYSDLNLMAYWTPTPHPGTSSVSSK